MAAIPWCTSQQSARRSYTDAFGQETHPSLLSPRIPCGLNEQGAAREEELLALWNCCHQLEREDAHRSLMFNLAYICFFPPFGVCSYSVLVSNPQGAGRDLKERGCNFRHLTRFRQLHLLLCFAQSFSINHFTTPCDSITTETHLA